MERNHNIFIYHFGLLNWSASDRFLAHARSLSVPFLGLLIWWGICAQMARASDYTQLYHSARIGLSDLLDPDKRN